MWTCVNYINTCKLQCISFACEVNTNNLYIIINVANNVQYNNKYINQKGEYWVGVNQRIKELGKRYYMYVVAILGY